MKTKVKTPKYYNGKNGYTAKEVVDNFDLPYHLGTKYYINQTTGMYEYEKGEDFMNKWKVLSPSQWETIFKEFFRVLKYGGYALCFSIDRQQDFFTYYARKAGFEVTQHLYWYSISGFPKSLNISKNLQKNIEKQLKKITGKDEIEWIEKK